MELTDRGDQCVDVASGRRGHLGVGRAALLLLLLPLVS